MYSVKEKVCDDENRSLQEQQRSSISLAEPEIFTRNRDTQSYDGTFALDVLSHMTAHSPLIYSVLFFPSMDGCADAVTRAVLRMFVCVWMSVIAMYTRHSVYVSLTGSFGVL